MVACIMDHVAVGVANHLFLLLGSLFNLCESLRRVQLDQLIEPLLDDSTVVLGQNDGVAFEIDHPQLRQASHVVDDGLQAANLIEAHID